MLLLLLLLLQAIAAIAAIAVVAAIVAIAVAVAVAVVAAIAAIAAANSFFTKLPAMMASPDACRAHLRKSRNRHMQRAHSPTGARDPTNSKRNMSRRAMP